MATKIEHGENVKWYAEFVNSQSPFQVKILQVCFLHPLQDDHFALKGRSFVVLCYAVQLLGMIVKLIEDVSRKGTDSSSAESLFLIVAVCAALYAYIYLSIYFQKILMGIRMMTQVQESNDLFGQKMVENIFGKAIAYNTILSTIFIPMGMFIGIAPLCIPILSSRILPGNQTFHKTLPLLYDFHINTDKYFYYFYAVQLMSIIYYVCILVSLSYFLSSSTGFLIGQLQVLQYYLKESDVGYYKFHANKEEAHGFLIKKLKQIIKKHYNCIELYKILQNISSSVTFVLIVSTSCVLVISGTLAVISVDSDFALAAKMMVVYLASIVIMIALCTPSQLLYNASDEMFIKRYGFNWYEYPPKARLFIILILLRTQTTFVLKAGTIINLNFETCSAVIKKSLSFIAAFRSLYATL